VGQLRSATQRWGPKQKCIQRAKVGHGLYKCECCGEVGPPTLPPPAGKKLRVKNIVADHVNPIVSVEVGFTTYDDWIERAFCEIEGFQALCHNCHVNIKTKAEKEQSKINTEFRKKYPKEYKSWSNMLSRCNNPKSTGYEYYGGRGIKVCEEWGSLKKFVEDMGERPEGYSIDRIDVDGDYERGNCRWASWRTQSTNRTNNHYISHKGICKTVSEWADDIGIPQNTLLYRIRRGWSKEEYLSKDTRPHPETSRLDEDTWREVAALRLQGYGIVELGEMFGIDSSQISRKTSKFFTEDDKKLLSDIQWYKSKYKSNEEKSIAKARRSKSK